MQKVYVPNKKDGRLPLGVRKKLRTLPASEAVKMRTELRMKAAIKRIGMEGKLRDSSWRGGIKEIIRQRLGNAKGHSTKVRILKQLAAEYSTEIARRERYEKEARAAWQTGKGHLDQLTTQIGLAANAREARGIIQRQLGALQKKK